MNWFSSLHADQVIVKSLRLAHLRKNKHDNPINMTVMRIVLFVPNDYINQNQLIDGRNKFIYTLYLFFTL